MKLTRDPMLRDFWDLRAKHIKPLRAPFPWRLWLVWAAATVGLAALGMFVGWSVTL